AADAARRAGRLDVARERYGKALAIAPQDLEALIGLGEVDLRDDKLDLAADTIGKALAQAPNNMRAQLAATEIALKGKKLEDAAARIKVLAERTPPPPIVEQARLKMLTGELLEAQGQEAQAIEAYLEAAKLAGDLDLTPTLTAASKLTVLAEAADQAKDTARAAELRARADVLLGNLADNAQKDPQLALTLGMAYLQANEPAKAEPWIRRVIEQRPKDVDAQYQLAKALARIGTQQAKEEAIERLRRAVELDPTRSEIGLELARTYEDSKREADAAKLYDKLLAAKAPTLPLRTRAGRFFARIDDMPKAGEQGVKILEVDPENPTGLYLKAEGLLRAGKADEARRLFQQASDAERDPQFLDGLGRAAEAWAAKSGESKYLDSALRAYTQASELDPTMLNPLVGQGRIYVGRNEDKHAIPPLNIAAKIRMTGEIARLLGLASKATQQIPVAVKWLEESNRLEPHALTSWHLGQLYTSASINQPGKAAGTLARATQLAEQEEKQAGTTVPWLTDALYMQGDVNRVLGNDAGARAAWEKYVARNPKPGAKLSEVKHFLATSLQR
ncbi:MAG: tetratricopeptide repeat protein, partial [Deltaproteobacteria bacterium]|nr:tetratricopeptide repeat protein [Deltaproteobacteria bacterium]